MHFIVFALFREFLASTDVFYLQNEQIVNIVHCKHDNHVQPVQRLQI